MNTGLLIVDAQEYFVTSPALIRAIVLESMRHACVVQTAFSHPANSLYKSQLDWHGEGGRLMIHNPQWPVLKKEGYGLASEHIAFLRDLRMDAWHLCGFETDACVLACAFSLWDAGIIPRVHANLCASHDADAHASALKIIKRNLVLID